MLKEIREQHGLSQNALAKATGIPQGVISYIESGKTKSPRIDTLQAIANALDCTVEDLVSKPKEREGESA